MTQSNQHLPAFSSLAPQICWQPVPVYKAKLLSEYAKMSGRWFMLATNHQWPNGYFRCESAEQDWFIKIVSVDKAQAIIEGDNIAQSLQYCIKDNLALLLNCLALDKCQLKLTINKQPLALLAYPMVHYRLSNFSQTDIQSIAKNLAKLHQYLVRLPNANHIKKHSDIKLKALKNIWQQIQTQPERFYYLPNDTLTVLQNESISLLKLLKIDAQVIHGDLNVGNILFVESNKQSDEKLMFIDFENSAHSYMSPLYDLAYIIARYIMPNSSAVTLTNFLDSYFAEINLTNKNTIKAFKINIANMLKAAPIYCLLLLVQRAQLKKHTFQTTEFNKFTALYHQSKNSGSFA
jgi:thiamine kinase-like enzyme